MLSYEDFEELHTEIYTFTLVVDYHSSKEIKMMGIRIIRSHDLQKGEWYFI